MSCFWDALFSSLVDNDYKFLYLKIYDIHNNISKVDKVSLVNILEDINKTNINDLILLLIRYNRKSVNVSWNGEKLSEKLIEESFDHVKDYLQNNDNNKNNNNNNNNNDKNNSEINIQNIINSGYLCSVCDPFLILICELFELEIEHLYMGHMMKYRNFVSVGGRRIIKFTSDQGHFKVG